MEGEEGRREGGSERGMGGGREGRRDGGTERGKEGRRMGTRAKPGNQLINHICIHFEKYHACVRVCIHAT